MKPAKDRRQIDEAVKDALLQFPTVDLIRKLFPDVNVRNGSRVMCNPLRGERHASLSVFTGRDGVPRWKDHATGESGDNIDFYRKAFPGASYVEALDSLANLLLGRSVFVSEDRVPSVKRRDGDRPNFRSAPHVPVVEKPGAITVAGVYPALPTSDVEGNALVGYWRSRGISDAVASRYCSMVEFINENVRGRKAVDPVSKLPILGDDGLPVTVDGRSLALGLVNDIGGWSLRVPDGPSTKGFKGCDSAFISVISADGTQPARLAEPLVKPYGSGQGFVEKLFHIPSSKLLMINPAQGFEGVDDEGFRIVKPFLEKWSGSWIEGRDMRRVLSVLSSVMLPARHDVAVVVEGMFDALSVVQLNALSGGGTVPGVDMVVLNSTSNASWAVPYLSAHRKVVSLLDVDLGSGTGQKTWEKLSEEVSAYSGEAGIGSPVLVDGSGFFSPHKDMNDYLKAVRGFTLAPSVPPSSDRKPSPSPRVKKGVKEVPQPKV